MKERKMYDWLIVVFLHEIQNDLDYSNAMQAAIGQAGGSDQIALFMIRDAVSVDDQTRQFSFELGVFRLQPAATGGWSFAPVESPDLKIRNENKNCWQEAFKFIYSNYFGERNMLITFSEGSGFGINVEQGSTVVRPDNAAPKGYIHLPGAKEPAANAAAEPKTRVMTNTYYVTGKGREGVIEKAADKALCKSLEVLWMAQMADALSDYLYGAEIDVFLMSNCFMQTFDTGYALSSKVKFLVAAEGYMSMRGYDFKSLLGLMKTDPTISSENLVKQALIDLNKLYLEVGDAVASSSSTIFANQLRFYPLALRVFEDLIEELEPLLPTIAPKLEAIRGQMLCVTNNPNYPLVDAGLWVKLVTEQITELGNAAYYKQLFGELQDKIVVGNLLDPLTQKDDLASVPRHGYSGISIYYPLDEQLHLNQEVAWCAYFDKSIPEPFRARSRWHSFLRSYFQALANVKKPA